VRGSGGFILTPNLDLKSAEDSELHRTFLGGSCGDRRRVCKGKVEMSAFSKVEMSAFLWDF
jgi:hypothetical protein